MRLRTGPIGPTPPRVDRGIRRRILGVYLPLRWTDHRAPCMHPNTRPMRPAEVRYALRNLGSASGGLRCTDCGRLLPHGYAA